MDMVISDRVFANLSDTFHQVSGIRLSPAKRQMVIGRLQRLAGERGARSLDEYVNAVIQGGDRAELTKVIDRLTTNETYFFREGAHFDFLAKVLGERPRGGNFRGWSAASSSGEEAYSIAMLLADKIGLGGWEIVGTDLSTAVLASAQRALYPMERAKGMPMNYLKRFCLKGQGPYEGHLLVDKSLRKNVKFMQANLMQDLPDLGQFDVVFLRNVLIYFDPEAKAQIVGRVLPLIRKGGYLFTGHSESLNQIPHGLSHVQPAIYART